MCTSKPKAPKPVEAEKPAILLYVPDEGNAKMYPLTRYVVDRDGMGSVLEIVTLDSIAPSSRSGPPCPSDTGRLQHCPATESAAHWWAPWVTCSSWAWQGSLCLAFSRINP